jgi:hypothetical protein
MSGMGAAWTWAAVAATIAVLVLYEVLLVLLQRRRLIVIPLGRTCLARPRAK